MAPPTKTPKQMQNKWARLGMMIVAAVGVLLVVVFAARGLRGLSPIRDYLSAYPGHSTLPGGTPVGLPAWLGWQHFLNSLLILLIIRSGWEVRTRSKPPAYWTRNNNGPVRTKGKPGKISLDLWFHLTLDALWVLNGMAFFVLLFITGQWARVVPTSWDVFPNALSALLQYASLDWPLENGWNNYNSLQLLSYFTTIFIAAPLAILTGLRMSGAWPKNATRLNRAYPITAARAVHLPVMIYFAAFILIHVTLVLATGAVQNLNHMYAANDEDGWAGLLVFAASLAVMVGAWGLGRPLFLRPVASLMGKVSR
ncbi:cytochrome b/b6 domain-containing protein [Paenarthrobacter sp. 22069]|uniref:cytochrome b/b6 domain-containing protein n=1 Tax=Paenarthrobacter sp. 22069 TaxID=3453864 RepID=UPI003F84DCA5